MFQVGDTVRYGQAGICRILEIRRMELVGEEQEYFILTPTFKSGSVLYVPCQNQDLVARMLPPLTSKEADEVLADVVAMEPVWVRDFRRRSDTSRKALQSGDRRDSLYLIKNIYSYKKDLLGEGKRIHTTDDYFLKDAENLIFHEFSVAWQMEYKDVANKVKKAFGCIDE